MIHLSLLGGGGFSMTCIRFCFSKVVRGLKVVCSSHLCQGLGFLPHAERPEGVTCDFSGQVRIKEGGPNPENHPLDKKATPQTEETKSGFILPDSSRALELWLLLVLGMWFSAG